ncbi:MAG: trimeric intracellular cation channel family protein [Chitinophagaceae bacterium]|nr:trimeric intracellular cation channel family protein [Bacteroidota bacterium]MCC6257135.1 trimeric intracellular cation channel family protein [Chitinophagaceae bacterium]MCW5917217.1 trimeric intracellular cation channel family protein [Ferruginibacter sp.]
MNHHQFLSLIEILGTFSFAVSGAFFAMEKRLDPFGVLILSFVTAIGGGTIRDMLLGEFPVAWMQNETLILLIFFSAVGTMFFGSWLRKINTTLFLFDAMGLGLFTIMGIEKALVHDLSMEVCIALGTVTGCFGGVIRDVLLNNVPLVFRKEIYAMASIAGGILYFLLRESPIDNDVAKIICILLIILVRILAVRFKWSLPAFYLKKNLRVRNDG